MNQLKSVYSIPFLDSYSHPIHTRLSIIASNDRYKCSCSWMSDHFSNDFKVTNIFVYKMMTQ